MTRDRRERTWRRDFLRRHPRIRYQVMTQTCDGYRWGRMPLKALFADMPGYDSSLKERYRCRVPAHWVFRALKPRGGWDTMAHDGVYCTAHLYSELEHPREWEHFRHWVVRQVEGVTVT